MSDKTVLVFCQNLLGLGHLVRTAEIARRLLNDFRVCLVFGGQPVNDFVLPPGLEIVQLPAIRRHNGVLEAVGSQHSLAEIKRIRSTRLAQVFDEVRPDVLLIEGFPFAKKSLAFELLPLLERTKSALWPVVVACSLRDVSLAKRKLSKRKEKRIRTRMNAYYDALLIHSDRNVIRLEDRFSQMSKLRCAVHYTGYVAQTVPPAVACEMMSKRPYILVSVGGGRLGAELLRSMVTAAALLERDGPHQIRMFTGPFADQALFDELSAAARRLSRLSVERYTPQLAALMSGAALSVSLCGYNTAMNIVQSGVRALVLPSDKDLEQGLRANRFEQLGLLSVLRRPHDLEPARLAERMMEALRAANERPRAVIDLHGPERTAAIIQQLIESKGKARVGVTAHPTAGHPRHHSTRELRV